MEKNIINTNVALLLMDSEFKKEDGQVIKYKQPLVILDNVEFFLFPSKEKKELFKYILNKYLSSNQK